MLMVWRWMACLAMTFAVTSLLADNLISNGDFEGDSNGWVSPDWLQNTVQPEIDKVEMPGPGKGSLRFIGEKDKRCIVYFPFKLPAGATKLKASVTIKTKGFVEGFASSYVTLTKASQNFAPIYTPSTYHGGKETPWTKYEDFFEVPAGAGPYGKMYLQMTPGIVGTAWFDNVVLEPVDSIPAKKPIVPPGEQSLLGVELGGASGVFEKSEEPYVEMTVKNTSKEGQSAVLDFTVSDYFGKKVAEFSKKLELPGMSSVKQRISLPKTGKLGFYGVAAKRKTATGCDELRFSYVVVDTPPAKPDHVFGMTFFANARKYQRTMKLMGVGTKGVITQWHWIEKNGAYDWSWTDGEVKACREAGIKIVGGIRMAGSLMPEPYKSEYNEKLKRNEMPFSNAYYEARSKFEKAAAERYKGDISEWAACQEINLCKDIPFEYDNYLKCVRNLVRSVKEVNPKATVVGIGCNGADGRSLPRFPFMRKLWYDEGLGDCLDGVGLDQYTAPLTYGPGYKPVNSEDGKLREIMLEAIRIVKSKGKTMVSIDEKGFNILRTLPPDSTYGVEMANVIAREYVIIKSLPEVGHLMYFKLDPAPADGISLIDWGLLSDNGPRPAVSAYAATARMMAHAQFIGMPELHKSVPCYLFRKDGKTLAVLWHSGNGAASMLASIPGKVERYDVQGNPFAIEGDEFKLSSAPIYIVSDAPVDAVSAALKKADIDLPEISAEFNIVKLGEAQVLAHNLTSKKLSASLDVNGVKKDVVFEADEVKTIAVQFPDCGKDISATFKTEKGRAYSFSDKFTLYSIPRVSSMEQTRALKPFEILSDGARHLNNVDFISNKLWTGPDDCSAELRIGYDDKSFYLNVRVKDEFHWNGARPAALWSGDSIQFAFDPNRDDRIKKMKGKTGFFDDDTLFSSAFADGKPSLFCDISSDPAMNGKEFGAPSITRDEKGKITEYSIAIPWEKLRLSPEKGRIFGFDVIALDSDMKGQMPPYWMQLTPGIAGGQRPDLFAGFILE